MKRICLFTLLPCLLLLGGCFNLSPAYAPPDLLSPLAAEYKEEQGWKTAQPMETNDRGPWWEVFGDSTLNALMQQVTTANQNIAVAAANLRAARMQIRVAYAALLPGASSQMAVERSGTEGLERQTRTTMGFTTQWEISFWNALPALEAARAQAGASAADFATTRLAMQAELAQAYFQLRMLDDQQALYESTVKAYARAVELTSSQFRGGLVTRMDVDQAESQLAAAQAQLAALQRRRAEFEHAIAILTGQMPSSFSLARGKLSASIPVIPTDIPSKLLERRPDIAAAERRVAAANQQIGLARSAWFPSLTLGADYTGQALGWHSAPVWTWAVGPSAALSLFQGGKRLAQSDIAWAGYEAEVAGYRQTVLQAVKDVEDSLSALRHLRTESEAQARAVRSSQSALRIAMSQYEGGMTTYLQVVSSQTAVLSAERSAIEAQGERLVTTVNLIKALGGGWQSNELDSLLDGKGARQGLMKR